jgi:4-amino-4-deoxy-L-arabinose transferase-like glycosyltransferase
MVPPTPLEGRVNLSFWKERRVHPVVWVVLGALCLRLLWVLIIAQEPARLTEPDSSGYLDSAQALIQDWRFNEAPGDPEPQFVRTPGYPLFLAFLMSFLGTDVVRLAVAQSVLSAVVVVPTYLLGARIFSPRIGLIAAILTAAHFQLIYYSGMMLTETLASLSVAVLALVLLRCVTDRRASRVWWLAAGLAIAAATMVRPTTYYLPILVLAGLVAAAAFKKLPWRTSLIAAAMMLIPVLVIIGGWQVRNEIRVDSSKLSGIDAVNLYLYRGAGVIGERDGRHWLDVQEDLSAEFGPRPPDEAQGPYYERMFAEGVNIVRDEPLLFAVVTWRGFLANVFGDARDTERILGYLGVTPAPQWRFLGYGFKAMVWSLAITGLISARKLPGRFGGAALLGATTFYVLAISAGPESYSRFRVPVTPLMMVLAAAGLYWLFQRAQRYRRSGPRLDQPSLDRITSM